MSSDEGMDIGMLMAPLTRYQLEMIIAQCIHKDESCLSILNAEFNKPLDTGDLSICDAVAALCDDPQGDGSQNEIFELMGRADCYATMSNTNNAILILGPLTTFL